MVCVRDIVLVIIESGISVTVMPLLTEAKGYYDPLQGFLCSGSVYGSM